MLLLWLRFRSWPLVGSALVVGGLALVALGPRAQAGNPLGESFVAVKLGVVVPALVCAVAVLAVEDAVSTQFGLRRARLAARAANLGAVFSGAVAVLWPLAAARGLSTVVIDVTVLLGVGLIGRRLGGVVAAWGGQLLVLLPHLVQPARQDTTWWAVLDGASADLALPVGIAAAIAGVTLTLTEPEDLRVRRS